MRSEGDLATLRARYQNRDAVGAGDPSRRPSGRSLYPDPARISRYRRSADHAPRAGDDLPKRKTEECVKGRGRKGK